MRKLLLILYCAFVTLKATHTFYVHNQNYFKGEKRGEKNNKGNWAILQPETFTTNRMNNSPKDLFMCLTL